jgi:mono/diheme cytochrome c family protein
MGPKLAKNPILTDERRFWDTVRQGRGAMPAWGAMLTAQEIADIQVWLKTLE